MSVLWAHAGAMVLYGNVQNLVYLSCDCVRPVSLQCATHLNFGWKIHVTGGNYTEPDDDDDDDDNDGDGRGGASVAMASWSILLLLASLVTQLSH